MHVFTRKVNERIMIGDDVIVAVIAISPHRVRLTIDAPKGVAVDREEVRVKQRAERPPPHT